MPTFKTKEEYERWKTEKLKKDENLINNESQEKVSILEGQEKEQDKQIQNKKACKQMATGLVIFLGVYFLSSFILSELILTESDRHYMTYIEETNKKIDKLNEKLLSNEERNKEIDRINKNLPWPIKYSPMIPHETDSTDEFIKEISFLISVISFCFYMAFLSFRWKKNSKKKEKL